MPATVLLNGFATRGTMSSNLRKGERTPGDEAILEWATNEGRILITMDKDCGGLVFKNSQAHAGLLRLPDVPVEQRIDLMQKLVKEQSSALGKGAIVTVRGDRVRVSLPDEKS